jgi:DNA-binding MarR family transcriptional regulator
MTLPVHTVETKSESRYTASDITDATRRLDIATTSLVGALSRALDISVPEMLALEHLDHAGTVGPSELARRLHLTTGAVTALADRLEQSGHLERAPHPTDRRRVLLKRTPKADEDLAREIDPMAQEILKLAERLSEEERQAVGRFLDSFITIIERTTAEACAR